MDCEGRTYGLVGFRIRQTSVKSILLMLSIEFSMVTGRRNLGGGMRISLMCTRQNAFGLSSLDDLFHKRKRILREACGVTFCSISSRVNNYKYRVHHSRFTANRNDNYLGPQPIEGLLLQFQIVFLFIFSWDTE